MLELVFKPLNYLSIEWKVDGHFSKKTFDQSIPLVIAILFSAILVCIEYYLGSSTQSNLNIFASDISTLMAGFLQTIPGFYIAALAAIATLTSPTMDRPMDGKPSTYDNEPLNRREFLARLFSYLSFISLSLYFFIIMLRYMYSSGILATTQTWYSIGYFFCLVLFFFLLVQLLLLTFLGLYYLGQRIHEN